MSQRPGRTGSGITLAAFVHGAAHLGCEQHVIVGTPLDDPNPSVGELPASKVSALVFDQGDLNFPLPGMSDVMPYKSSVFSQLSSEQLQVYRQAWQHHIRQVIRDFQPELIHSHHIWIVSSLLKDVAASTPVVTSCHATGLRQMKLCPHLAEEVHTGCARIDAFCVLHEGHAEDLAKILGVSQSKIHIVGAGFDERIFHIAPPNTDSGKANQIVYAGKYSRAKGLPSLLDAIEKLSDDLPDICLHVAGSGDSDEANSLRRRMEKMAPRVKLHGQLSQNQLADLLQKSKLFVLPSFYEGLPLVVVEAIACGCRVVCTDLPGVRIQLEPALGEAMTIVDLPQMKTVDQPMEDALPEYVDRLCSAIEQGLSDSQLKTAANLVESFTWNGVFKKVEDVWVQALSTKSN